MTVKEDFGILGDSAVIRRLRSAIARIAPSSLPVLVQGPTGAGKELIARAIHTASRRAGPLVAFNVCALPEGTLEAALFGHVRGGFTGAVTDAPGYLLEAHGGTAFFDEIGGLALSLQSKLLRAIETGQFRPVGGRADRSSDFRVVAASNEDIASMTERGGFRSDLLFRLRGAVLLVPALVEHAEDIPVLASHFLQSGLCLEARAELSQDALRMLRDYHWPGNIRQLRLTLEHAALLADGGRIGREELSFALAEGESRPQRAEPLDLGRRRFLALMEEVRWDTVAAGRRLGIHRATVYRRMQRLGIAPPRQAGVGFASVRANLHAFAATTPAVIQANAGQPPAQQ